MNKSLSCIGQDPYLSSFCRSWAGSRWIWGPRLPASAWSSSPHPFCLAACSLYILSKNTKMKNLSTKDRCGWHLSMASIYVTLLSGRCSQNYWKIKKSDITILKKMAPLADGEIRFFFIFNSLGTTTTAMDHMETASGHLDLCQL